MEETLTLTVAEAGKLLRLSKNVMYEGIRTGQIPSIRIGRKILIPRASLERLLSPASMKEEEPIGLSNMRSERRCS